MATVEAPPAPTGNTDSQELAGFGYKQELDRSLGSFSSFAAGFSYISILTGVFQLFYLGYAEGGAAYWWTWPMAFAGQALVALCFCELAARYPTNVDRVRARAELVPLLAERFRARKTDEWVKDLWAAAVPSGPVNTIDRVLADPQVRHRGMVVSDGVRELVGNPIKNGEPDTFTPAPALGQHTAEVLGSPSPQGGEARGGA